FNRRQHETMALVGHTRSALGSGGVGVLHGDRTAGDQRILAVIDRVREGVSQTEVETAGHAAANRNSGTVIDAGSRTVEFIDGTKARDGSCQRVDTGWVRTSHRASHLPG